MRPIPAILLERSEAFANVVMPSCTEQLAICSPAIIRMGCSVDGVFAGSRREPPTPTLPKPEQGSDRSASKRSWQRVICAKAAWCPMMCRTVSMKGRTCPLAKFGHNRDVQQGLPITVYGVMTNGEGCPVAVSVYEHRRSDHSCRPNRQTTGEVRTRADGNTGCRRHSWRHRAINGDRLTLLNARPI